MTISKASTDTSSSAIAAAAAADFALGTAGRRGLRRDARKQIRSGIREVAAFTALLGHDGPRVAVEFVRGFVDGVAVEQFFLGDAAVSVDGDGDRVRE